MKEKRKKKQKKPKKTKTERNKGGDKGYSESNMNYHRKNLTYLKQVYTSQSNHIKFENPKSSLPLKRSIVPLLTILNPMKPKVR